MSVSNISNLEDIKVVADISRALNEVPTEIAHAYLSNGSILVWSKDDYQIGEFYLEDDFWLFRWGPSEDEA